MAEQPRRNVLFVIIDDLRPQLAYRGRVAPGGEDTTFMRTPHLDRFATEAVSFPHAHVQVAQCSPSRTSVLFGRRPDTTGIYDLTVAPRDGLCARCETLPQRFKQAGYVTAGIGKILHLFAWTMDVDPTSEHVACLPWSSNGMMKPHWASRDAPDNFTLPCDYQYGPGSTGEDARVQTDGHFHHTHAVRAAPDAEALADAVRVDLALPLLSRLLGQPRPWFFALGLVRPHLPFVAPQRHFDMYPLEEIRLATNAFCPWKLPFDAFKVMELTAYDDVSDEARRLACNVTLDDSTARRLRQGYFASASHADEQFGRVLDHLRPTDAWHTTVVIMWGDHGWKLGDHGSWAKHDTWDVSTRIPLLLRVPGVTPQAGAAAEGLVEAVDIFATVWEAATGTTVPECPAERPWEVPNCTEGVSFLPLAAEPSRSWKRVALSQYRYKGLESWVMSYSITTAERWRFAAWVQRSRERRRRVEDVEAAVADDTAPPSVEWALHRPDMESGSICVDPFGWCGGRGAFELYDHNTDPGETRNRAYDEPRNASRRDVARLYRLLEGAAKISHPPIFNGMMSPQARSPAGWPWFHSEDWQRAAGFGDNV